MPRYRMYFLDSLGRILEAPVYMDCPDDRAAVCTVLTQHAGHRQIELWEGDRYVKRFPGGISPSVAA